MADDRKTEIDELKRLSKLYEQLTKKPAPVFDTSSFEKAQAAVEGMSLALEEAKDRAASLSEGFKGVEDDLNNMLGDLGKSNTAISLATKSLKGLRDIAQKLSYDEAGIAELNKKQLLSLQSKQKIQQRELENQSLRLAREKGIGDLYKTNLNSVKDLSNQEYAILTAAQEQLPALQNLNILLNQRILKEKRIEELMGLGGVVLKGIEQSLNKLGLGGLASALGIDEALDKMRELAKTIEQASGATLSFADKIKVLKNGFESIIGSVRESLTDPLAVGAFLATQIIDAFLSLDKSTAELAKNFGISYSAAAEVSDELNTAANASYLLNITTQGLTESFIALNNQFGTFAQISEEALTTFTRLTKEAGLSAESAGMLFRTTVLTGKEVEGTTKEFLGEAAALAATNGVALNQKQILESIKDVSQATLLSFDGQADRLAEAIVQAKLLGVNLGQVEDIAQSLLQFESSISSELEAELLTGKNLNLEKARLAAINNDLATVASEIAKQVGTAAEFTAMNVIQQEALAKSVGLTREDLAKSLIEREALVKLSGVEGKTAQERFNNLVKEVGLEEAKKRLGDEALANQLAGQSVQERFTASIEKLKEVFISLVEPLMPVLDVFAEIAGIVSALVAGPIGQMLKFTVQLGKVLLPIYGIYKAIQIIQASSFALQQASLMVRIRQKGTEAAIGMEKRLQYLVDKRSLAHKIVYYSYLAKEYLIEKGKALFKGIQLAYEQTMLGIKRIGSVIAKSDLVVNIGKAAMGAIASLSSIPVIGYALGLAAAGTAIGLGMKYLKGDDVMSQGYGKRTLMAPEGAIQLNDKDTVIAGTDLGGGTSSSSGGGSTNMAPLVAELQAIKILLNTVLNKEGTISINGTTVATAIYPDIQRMSRLKDFKTQ